MFPLAEMPASEEITLRATRNKYEDERAGVTGASRRVTEGVTWGVAVRMTGRDK